MRTSPHRTAVVVFFLATGFTASACAPAQRPATDTRPQTTAPCRATDAPRSTESDRPCPCNRSALDLCAGPVSPVPVIAAAVALTEPVHTEQRVAPVQAFPALGA